MLEGGVKISAEAGNGLGRTAPGDLGDGFADPFDVALAPGDLLGTLADRFVTASSPIPFTSHTTFTAPAVSASFNASAPMPMHATTQLAAINTPPVTELRSSQATVAVITPQQAKDQAMNVSNLVDQSRREIAQSFNQQIHGAQAGTAAGTSLSSGRLGSTFGNAAMGVAFGFAADAAAPGAGAVIGAMAAGAEAARTLHGGGTQATFMEPLSKSFSVGAGRKGRSHGYERSAFDAGAPAPATQTLLDKMSQGPGFGARPVGLGDIALSGQSLAGIKAGNINTAPHMRDLDRLDEQCTRALDALHVRDQKGLVLDQTTVGEMLERDIRLNPNNPTFVSGMAV